MPAGFGSVLISCSVEPMARWVGAQRRHYTQIGTLPRFWQCPDLLPAGAPLPRRTAVPQHRHHQTRTLPRFSRLSAMRGLP